MTVRLCLKTTDLHAMLQRHCITGTAGSGEMAVIEVDGLMVTKCVSVRTFTSNPQYIFPMISQTLMQKKVNKLSYNFTKSHSKSEHTVIIY